MRWIVGDVHGCVRELERLLAGIDFDRSRDELWSVGDLVNTGPHSTETLRLWLDCGGRGVIGNHDAYALLVHSGARSRKGDDTLEELFAAPDSEELLAALRSLPALVHLPAPGPRARDVWLVHAGLHPGWRDLHALARRLDAAPHDDAWLESDEVRFATRARCCSREGRVPRYTGVPLGCPEGTRPWDDFYAGPDLVVHGHWARRGFYRGAKTLGLDSGCVYGGSLTAWCQDDERIAWVDAKSTV